MNMQSDSPSEALTVKETANILKVQPRTVRKLIDTGQLRASDINTVQGGRRRLRIQLEDLQAFLDGRAVQSAVTKRKRRKTRKPLKRYF